MSEEYFSEIKNIKKLCFNNQDQYYLNKNFLRNNEDYNNFNYKYISTYSESLLMDKKNISLLIDNPSDGENYFLSNIKINNQKNIQSIELQIGGSRFDIIYNFDGIFFGELRNLFEIEDETIIPFPFLFYSKFIPIPKYFNIKLIFKFLSELGQQIQINYDIYKLESESPKTIEFLTMQSQFNGDEQFYNRQLQPFGKFLIDFNYPLLYIILYLPNNKLISCELNFQFGDRNLKKLQTNITETKNCYLIKFVPSMSLQNILDYSINFSGYDKCVMTLQTEKYFENQLVYIIGINAQIVTAESGFIGIKYCL